MGPGLHRGRRPADARVLDRPVRPRLRPVRHHALAVGGRDGGPARPRPRPGRRRRRPQLLRGLPDRRRLRRRQVGAARPRPLDRRLRPARRSALLSIAEVQRRLEAADRPRRSRPSGSTAGSSAGSTRATAASTAATTSPSTWPATPARRRWSTCAAARRCAATCSPAWTTARRSSSGAGTTTRRHPRPRAVADLGQPAGAMYGSPERRRLPARARPGSPTPSTPTGPTSPRGDYREGVVEEDDRHVVFEFHTPYIIAATPPNDKPWGIYEPGCRNGLVLRGQGGLPGAALDRPGRDLAGLRPLRRRPGPDRPRQGAAAVPPPLRRGREGAGRDPG